MPELRRRAQPCLSSRCAVPVNSCLLFTDRERAQSWIGRYRSRLLSGLQLHIQRRMEAGAYGLFDLYEETRFSPTFKAFHRELASS
jgi:hypothetical protein